MLACVGETNDSVMEALKAYTCFYLLATLPSHTEQDLRMMQEQYHMFLQHAQVFRDYSGSDFRFIKMHMMSLYAERIRHFGAPDNTSTSPFENLHISRVKRYVKLINNDVLFEKQVRLPLLLTVLHE